MWKCICGIVAVAAPVVMGLAGAPALPAAASAACMTQAEARKAFPRDHIYWHGTQHCWDNVANRRQNPAATANAKADADAAQPGESGQPAAMARPADRNKPGETVAAAPVPFVGSNPGQGLFWSTLNVPARAQQEASAEPAVLAPPATVEHDDAIAIGAPGAKPGSPEDLLEHCCWPPTASESAREDGLLRGMVLASTSACGLAIGLWLLVFRRKQQAVRSRWS